MPFLKVGRKQQFNERNLDCDVFLSNRQMLSLFGILLPKKETFSMTKLS